MFELQHVFDVFLPQLLLYPNPKDPLNGAAAYLMLKDPEQYKNKVDFYILKTPIQVKEYVKKYANDPELVARAAKQLSESKPEEKKNEPDKADSEGELSETSLKSDDDEDIE